MTGEVNIAFRGYCPSCEKKTEFRYLGRQETFPGESDLVLYNCDCNSTFNFDTVATFNELRLKALSPV